MRDMITAGARALALAVLCGFSSAGTAAAQPSEGAVAPPSAYLECWSITQSFDAKAQTFGGMICRCRGLFSSREVEIGPVVVGPSAPNGANGGLLPNCYAIEVTTPAYNEASPGGTQNLKVVHVPVIADHYSCDRGGCYWFHGSAECAWVRSEVAGFRPYYTHVGTCGEGGGAPQP